MRDLDSIKPLKENLIEYLHLIQNKKPTHYISKEDIKQVAEKFSLPLSHISGVISFYSMFSEKKRGKYIIRVCESPPCHLMGSESIIDTLEKILDINIGQTTQDGLFTLETSSCLGVCGVAPAMMINETIYGNLTASKIVKIINYLRRQEEVSV